MSTSNGSIRILLLAALLVGAANAKPKKNPLVYDHVGRITYVLHNPTMTYQIGQESGWCDVTETRVECTDASPAIFTIALEDRDESDSVPLEWMGGNPISDIERTLLWDRKQHEPVTFNYRLIQANERVYGLTYGHGGYCIPVQHKNAGEACYQFWRPVKKDVGSK